MSEKEDHHPPPYSSTREDGTIEEMKSFFVLDRSKEDSEDSLRHHQDHQKRKHSPTPSVPIVKHINRTPSEVKLAEEETMADYRDYCMYARILNGMNRRNTLLYQQEHQHYHHLNNKAVASSHKVMSNIMRTRNLPMQHDLVHSFESDFFKYALDVPPRPALLDHPIQITSGGTSSNATSDNNDDKNMATEAADALAPPTIIEPNNGILEGMQMENQENDWALRQEEEGVFILDL